MSLWCTEINHNDNKNLKPISGIGTDSWTISDWNLKESGEHSNICKQKCVVSLHLCYPVIKQYDILKKMDNLKKELANKDECATKKKKVIML